MTIVLLPGLLCDEAAWETQRRALEQLAPVHVADLSAHDTITGMARAVLEEVSGPLIVAGHSMGGRVALEIVRLAPERVEGLVLADTGIHPRRNGEEDRRSVLVRLAYERGMGALADLWLPPMVDPRRLSDIALLSRMKDMVLRSTPERHERQIRALLGRPDARDCLAAIRIPTLVMVGRQDRWSPLAQHEEIAASIAGSRLEVIEDSGHMSLMERPERTTEVLADWLQGVVRDRHGVDRVNAA